MTDILLGAILVVLLYCAYKLFWLTRYSDWIYDYINDFHNEWLAKGEDMEHKYTVQELRSILPEDLKNRYP